MEVTTQVNEVRTGMIFEAINGVMRDIGSISKDKVNKQQGFKYRGIDEVMNALQPALVNNGVFIVPEVIDEKREERQTQKGGTLFYTRLTVIHHFFASDGSSISTRVIGEAMDSSDKASNKAMSIAYKYACFYIFCIPTEEMQDSDVESPESVQSKEEQQMIEEASNAPIDKAKLKILKERMAQKGVSDKQIMERYKVEKLEELNTVNFMKACSALEKMPDKEPEQLDLGL